MDKVCGDDDASDLHVQLMISTHFFITQCIAYDAFARGVCNVELYAPHQQHFDTAM